MSKNIYKNDLKFEDQDDTNKIKLRLKIFKDEKYDNLDLSKLNENMVNKVFKSKIFLQLLIPSFNLSKSSLVL